MRIVRFYAKWYKKCKLFENKELLGYDQDIDIDLPSYHKYIIKYQVSIIPTFIAFNSRNKVIGKLSNPIDVDEYFEWKERIDKK